MMTTCAEKRVGEKGFSLIEALAALALTGLVLSALATITAQWLPNWNRGFDRIQQSELVGISMRRIAADLAAAEYVPPNRDQDKPLFDGSALSVTFVRTALGPNVGVGLDVVRIGETTDQGRLVTVRSRAAFGPLPPGLSPLEQINVSDPVVLLRPPFRLSFAYAGPDRVFRDTWQDADGCRRDHAHGAGYAGGRILSVSAVTPVHVDAPAGFGNPMINRDDTKCPRVEARSSARRQSRVAHDQANSSGAARRRHPKRRRYPNRVSLSSRCYGFSPRSRRWRRSSRLHLSSSARALAVNDTALRAQALISASVELSAYQLQLAGEQARPAQGSFRTRLNGADLAVSFVSEAARVDLNKASKELLAGLLSVLGAAEDNASEYADRIIAWRSRPTRERRRE